MSIKLSVKSFALLAACAIAGCDAPQRDPLPYSPNYQYLDGQGTGLRKGVTGTQRLVPDACLTPDVVADPLYLPSGCANNLNLQQMVVNQNDLLQGRQTGPAMAAPLPARRAR